jgi:hypothetical protein
MLTRRQRNAIFETLAENGLDPARCDLEEFEMVGQRIATVRHEASDSRFRFWPDDDLDFRYRADIKVGSVDSDLRSSYDWDQLIDVLTTWARDVRYEIATPDLWVALREVPQVVAAVQAADASNAPFTPDEQAEIADRLEEVKQLVREQFDLTSEQSAAIDQRLDEVKEESKHQGRKAWLYTFYGAVMSTFMTDEIPPHVVQTIVSTVVHGISHLFGFGGPPPIIST